MAASVLGFAGKPADSRNRGARNSRGHHHRADRTGVRPVSGEPALYSAQLWLMTSGAYSIFVNAEGEAGSGTTVVPINSIATTRLEMSRWFSGGLLAFALFLVLALVSLVGAAVRESMLPP